MTDHASVCIDELHHRVQKLERVNVQLRRVIYVGGAGLALLLMGQGQFPDVAKPKPEEQPTSFDVVSAKELRIVDEKGTTRMELKLDVGMPVLRMYDDGGVARIKAIANAEWPIVELADKAGRARLSLGASPDGPGIIMQTAESRPRAVLSDSNDGPGLVLFDKQRPRVLVGVKNNQPVMAVLNGDSKLMFEPSPEAPIEDGEGDE